MHKMHSRCIDSFIFYRSFVEILDKCDFAYGIQSQNFYPKILPERNERDEIHVQILLT